MFNDPGYVQQRSPASQILQIGERMTQPENQFIICPKLDDNTTTRNTRDEPLKKQY